MGGTPAPVLNECLEEAVGRCLEVTRWMSDTGEVADAIAEGARQLGLLTASDEAQAVHEACTSAGAAVGRLRDELDVEEDALASSLSGLAGQVKEASDAIGHLLAGVREHAGLLADVRQSVTESVEGALDGSRTGFDELAQAVAAYAAALDDALEQAADVLEPLRDAVRAARAHLERAQEKWTAALGRLSANAIDTTREMAAGVDAAMGALGREAVEFANHAIDRHNLAVLALRRGYTEESSDPYPDPSTPAPTAWLTAFVDPLSSAAETLEAAEAAAQETLTAEVDALAQEEIAARRAALGVDQQVGRVAPSLP